MDGSIPLIGQALQHYGAVMGNAFRRFLVISGNPAIAGFQRDDMKAWVQQEDKRGLMPHSLGRRLANLHACVAFLVREGKVNQQVLFLDEESIYQLRHSLCSRGSSHALFLAPR